MFADRAKIYVRSGKGGDGHVSFRREKYVPSGGPDGGDGGHGGDVIFVVDEGLNTLIDFRHIRKYKAGDGEEGGKKNCRGKDGEDIIIKVPAGTVIKEAQSGQVITDMSGDNKRVVLLKGGKGGNGNQHYATSTMQAPKYAQPGQAVLDELVRGYDTGAVLRRGVQAAIVGSPNVGKSTFLSRVTNARPKIANYHFTTLNPNLGVVDLEGTGGFVIADIPGLIEGASEGVGLGHEFLRHIERTALIVQVVDLTGDWEGRDPLEDYEIIKNELALYADELAARPRIVVANKIDAPGTEEACEALAARVREDSIAAAGGNEFVESPIDPKLYRISALTGAGVDSLKAAIATKVHALREAAREQAASDMQYDHVWELRREAREKRFDIISEGPGAWRVSGVQVERMVVQTDWENEEAVAFFQHRFKRMGVDTALEKAGARDGDEVRILGFSFAFESPTAGAVDVYQELDI